MTRDEYFARDIIDRLLEAREKLCGEDGFGNDGIRDPFVYQSDSGFALGVTDVIADAIMYIKAMREDDVMGVPDDINPDSLVTAEIDLPAHTVLRGIAGRVRDIADELKHDELRQRADQLAELSMEVARQR